MARAKMMLVGYYMDRFRANIPYTITGLSGTDEQRALQMFTADGLPKIDLKDPEEPGDPHPFRPELICNNIQIVRVDGLDTGLVNAVYELDESASDQSPNGAGIDSITWNTQIYSVETEYDHDNFPIIVKYNYASSSPTDPGECNQASDQVTNPATPETGLSTSAVVQCQVGKVTKYVTIGILKIRRKEKGIPLRKSMSIMGRTNMAVFQGEAVDAWLSAGCSVVSTDSGKNSIVEYEFHLNEEGWLKTAAYIIPATGRPHVLDSSPFEKKAGRPALDMIGNHKYANGYTLVRVQGGYDFGLLGLPDLSKVIK